MIAVRRLAGAVALAVPLAMAEPIGAAAQDTGWRSLVSRVHGVSVAFPADLILEQRPAAEGRFALQGGGFVELNVSALRGESLGSFVRRHVLRNIRVTYRRPARDWMAYSGYRGANVVYGRTIVSCGGRYAHTFVLTYPDSARRLYDRIAERMSLTMRVTDSFEREYCP